MTDSSCLREIAIDTKHNLGKTRVPFPLDAPCIRRQNAVSILVISPQKFPLFRLYKQMDQLTCGYLSGQLHSKIGPFL